MKRSSSLGVILSILVSLGISLHDTAVAQVQSPAIASKTVATSVRFFTGAIANDFFGASVSSAGDVNGDGQDDIIVGAPYSDAGGTDAGRAYVYFGRTSMDNAPDVILTGAANNDYFGFSVAGAGDVNGDGYGDVIVGAFSNDAGGANAGRAYVFFGGAMMDNTADAILTGEAPGDQFGMSVASAGDVNGDGYGDVIVGAQVNDAGGADAGRAYVYFGGSVMNSGADVVLTGAAADDRFGYSVSGAGDVNGDGYGDVIVGAWANDAGGPNAGSASLYFGGASMDSTADVNLTGPAAGDYFGFCASSAGDVNGDGYGDVVIGAYWNDAGGSDAGRAYVFFGGASMNSTADVILTGAAAGDWFGYSVSNAGDVNGDGYGDVIIGAYQNDAGGANAGRAYVYFGGTSMNSIADVILTGTSAGDSFGCSVSSGGDLNGDGLSDVIVGAQGNDAGGTNAGRAYVITNALAGTDIADEFFTGAAVSDLLGASVSSAGDLNGDGYGDLVVGAWRNDAGGTDAGRAYVYFGGPGMDNTADVIFTGEASDDALGLSLAAAGDVNGDGYDDVVIGAPNNDAGGTLAGRAYVHFGGASMDSAADVVLTGGASFDRFGYSVSGAGDVNGDGYSDLVVGAIDQDSGGTDAGRAYVYFGGSSMDGTPDVVLTGATAGDNFGISVANAGDVNGDGYGDVIVGAWLNDAGGTNAGRAYVFFGGASMDHAADVILTGAAADDYFGQSSAGAGDVNGDGYGDIVVGAQSNDAGGANAGGAYVFFGGASVDDGADVILTGFAANDQLGYSVSSAGDVNGDGYGDVIIGTYGNDAAGVNAGRAYVYFGGGAMDSAVDVLMSGAAPNDFFGFDVSSAGDVNGDGCGDLVIGAPNNDAGGSDAGRAYLYLSSSPPIVPRISAVRDIPFDQGGAVELRWIRSAYDARGLARVTAYSIERSRPGGSSGFFWEEIARLSARQNSRYSFTASMPNDSMSGNSGAHFFRVTAVTANPNEYWRSNIISGYSVDNLAPAAPTGPSIIPDAGGPLRVSWTPNRYDPDVRHYAIYRSTSNGFIPASGNRIATTPDSTYLDNATSIGTTYYYRVTTVDIHGNESTPTSQLSMAALNVQLSSFTASPQTRGAVRLEWTTASETENYGFSVERRNISNFGLTSANWEKIGFVSGSGTTSSQRSYAFTDNVSVSGRYAYRLMQVSQSGASAAIQEIEVDVNAVPAVFDLAQNYPNPFNPSTVIRYDLPVDSRVQLTIYNIVGQPVGDLVEAQQSAGFKEVRWDATGLPSGMYFYRLQATGTDGARFASIKKMMLVR